MDLQGYRGEIPAEVGEFEGVIVGRHVGHPGVDVSFHLGENRHQLRFVVEFESSRCPFERRIALKRSGKLTCAVLFHFAFQ